MGLLFTLLISVLFLLFSFCLAGDEVGREPHPPVAPDRRPGGGPTKVVKAPTTAAAAKPATGERDGVMPNRQQLDAQELGLDQLKRLLAGDEVVQKPHTPRAPDRLPGERSTEPVKVAPRSASAVPEDSGGGPTEAVKAPTTAAASKPAPG